MLQGSDRRRPGGWFRRALRWLLALVYVVAGVLHLTSPEPFLSITPAWVPCPRWVIALTGLCKITGGVGLLTVRMRKLAGVMLALYAVGVFPANVRHAVEGIAVPGLPQSWWYHGPRLALKPVFVWWALFGAGVIDWPLRSRPSASWLRRWMPPGRPSPTRSKDSFRTFAARSTE